MADEAIVIPKAEYDALLRERDELARLKYQPLDEHPLDWRLGTKLDYTALGPVSLYDGTIEGDGGRPGRWIGVMFSAALGRRVVEAVNGPSPDAPSYGELIQAEADARAELGALKAEMKAAHPEPRREATTTREEIRAAIEEWRLLAAVLDGPPDWDRLAERIDRALFELPEDQERALEEWAADEVAAREATRTSLAELEAEVRRLLYLYDHPSGGTDIERRSSIGIEHCPRITAALAKEEGATTTPTEPRHRE